MSTNTVSPSRSVSRSSALSSAPSSTVAGSGSTSGVTDLMTPAEGEKDGNTMDMSADLTNDEIEEMQSEADAARGRMGKIGTRSMQDIKEIKGRARSLTDAKPPPLQLIPPVPTIQARNIPDPPKSNNAKTGKSNSFSSFLRRLTGKGPKKDKTPAPTPALPIRAPTISRQVTAPVRQSPPSRPPAIRQESAPANSMSSRQSTIRQKSLPSTTPTARETSSVQARSASARPTRTPSLPRQTDPVFIPLPPSPTLTPVEPDVEVLADTAPRGRIRSHPMLSLEGFEMDEEQETDEEADQVRPLQPLRITIADRSISPDSSSLRTGSSVDSAIITPTSTSTTAGFGNGYDSSPERVAMRLAGSSPPRKAPIGSGFGLERKESKWRKSVMGISDSLGGPVSRKNTTRQPPSSHDAYLAQQKRIASNRASCQPTLHSNASIAAGLTSIKSKEEQEVAETFFLS